MISLVPATGADIPEIQRLAEEIWREVYPGIISEDQICYMLAKMYSTEQLRDDLERGVEYFQVDLEGDGIVGFAAIGPAEVPHEFELHKIYLEPANHGKGLGSSTLRAIVSHVNQARGKAIHLRVNRNNRAAIRCYERNGFSIEKELCSEIGKGFVMDDFIMVRRLAPLPPNLLEIVEFFEPLSEQERRDALVAYANTVESFLPLPDQTYLTKIMRQDQFCLDEVGVFLAQDEQGAAVFHLQLGTQVQTLTRAMTAILCKGLNHEKPETILQLCEDFVPRIVGGNYCDFEAVPSITSSTECVKRSERPILGEPLRI